MLLEVESSQLVLVDYQIKLMPAMKDAQAVWQRAAVMARTAQLFTFQCGPRSKIHQVWVKQVPKSDSIANACCPKWRSVLLKRDWVNG